MVYGSNIQSGGLLVGAGDRRLELNENVRHGDGCLWVEEQESWKWERGKSVLGS